MSIAYLPEEIEKRRRENAPFRKQPQKSGVVHDGGDGQGPGMQADLAVLKQRGDHADQRMDRIEQKLDRVVDKLDTMNERLNSRLDGLATKTTVWSALGTGAALSFAVVAIFVGVLAYLQDQRIALRPEAAPAAAAPIILQLPPWPTAPVPTAPAAPPG